MKDFIGYFLCIAIVINVCCLDFGLNSLSSRVLKVEGQIQLLTMCHRLNQEELK